MRPDPASNSIVSSSTVSRSRTGISRFLSIALLALFGLVAHSATASAITLHVRFGSAAQNCRSVGICRIWLTNAAIEARPVDAVLDGDRLKLALQEPLADTPDLLPVDRAIELDAETARALGVETLAVLPGSYRVDYSNNPNGEVTVNVTSGRFIVNVDWGRPSRNCRGIGICRIIIGFPRDHDESNRIVGSFGSIKGDKLRIDFGEQVPEQGEELVIEENIMVEMPTARGKEKWCEVRSGTYRIDYSSNPNGSVELDMARLGIWINIKIGRRDQGCTGFGICSITWGTDRFATPLSVGGIAGIDGDRLTVDFTSPLSGNGEPLVIDEDIELDAKTSALFGAKRAVIAKGVYPVDYAKNPNGSVELPVQRFGITVTIHVGRFSKGCGGMGFCGITIETSAILDDRNVPIDGILIGLNRLRVRFLAELPEQGDVISVEKPLSLDEKVADALGLGAMTILPGEYQLQRDAAGNAWVDVNVTRQSITIWVKFGQLFNNCRGFGICAIGTDRDLIERPVVSDARLEGTTLTVAFGAKAEDAGEYLTIDEAIKLDDATAQALGSRSLTLLPGRYKVDYSDNPNGTVELRTMRVGITIEIETGRRSQGCTGFGICSITIDPSLRTVPTIGSIEGDKLHLDLGTFLPNADEDFVIDEDIELNAKTARGLGRRSVTIKKGVYKVHTDPNGEQSVDLDIAARGIGITIRFGWRGCAPGFGICAIIVDLHPSHDAAQAVAEVVNGKLVVDLLGEAPYRQEMLVLEESVALDAELLKRLGYDTTASYSLRAGAYNLDTTENEYGTLRLATERNDGTASIADGRSGLSSATSATPNPTSGAAAIRYSLPRASAVTLTVVDVRGIQVDRLLDNENRSAGEHSVNFDAAELPAGIYYYTIDASGSRITGSVTVVR